MMNKVAWIFIMFYTAFRRMCANYMSILPFTLTFLVLYWGLHHAFPIKILEQTNHTNLMFASVGEMFLYASLGSIVMCAMFARSRGQSLTSSQLIVSGLSKTGPVFVAGMILFAPIMLQMTTANSSVMSDMPGLLDIAIAIFALILLMIGFILQGVCFTSQALIVHDKCGALQSLRESLKMTKGNRVMMCAVVLVLLIVIMSTSACLDLFVQDDISDVIIGFFSFPFSIALTTVAYDQLKLAKSQETLTREQAPSSS